VVDWLTSVQNFAAVFRRPLSTS